ncbi:MAG: FMN-binding protein [Desulfobulbaceae bacterium]|nr:MAG: FMN-binding protein [Desulfobulbaceae bacterium]
MKDIFTIIIRLTVSCILAATVMGSAFIVTNKAKKHNEHVNEQKVRYALLGYSADKPIPDSMALHEVYRYIVSDKQSQYIGYLLSGKEGFIFLTLDLSGKVIDNKSVEVDEAKVLEKEERDKVVNGIVGAGKDAKFADQTIIVTNNGERIAYLLDGKFTGFKTFIGVMLATDPKFTLLGLEILEHEEDPGLGAEIEQDYFRNQFKGKTFEQLKDLDVVKEPLPDEYFQALEGDIAAEDAAKILKKYGDKDIYALTGATISSRSVNNGVKSIVKKFAYRLNILDTALAEQKIEVAF